MARRIGWDPWADLPNRTHIVLGVDHLPAGVRGAYFAEHGRAALLVEKRQDRLDRLETVAHELTHEDLPGASEARVNDEVARRLVPFDDLAAMYEIAVLNDLTVEPWQVAEHFDVPERVAERAMRLFLRTPQA